ncbi:Tyrosine kinase receptor Cad96Ca [Amphibalanus amphitrite]|uniref:Tyrosine kinase receptor Cad96Ca n=1 Tax=Amphibalanus amphitrite TaxID=1232801 RepID=A0A6A4WE69_AMPAM|nr:Tyrosine kinase receptor Cad96Ca [Amphibalanus amphitrite]
MYRQSYGERILKIVPEQDAPLFSVNDQSTQPDEHGDNFPLREVPLEEVVLHEVLVEEVSEEDPQTGPLYLVSLLFVLPVVAVAAWYLKRYHLDMTSSTWQQLVPERLKSMLAPDSPHLTPPEPSIVSDNISAFLPTVQAPDTISRRRKWEYPRHKLRMQSIVGEGHFGQDLLRELRIMMDLGTHDNVVTLLGCCTEEEPTLVIMEYVRFGKLLTFLRENRGRHHYLRPPAPAETGVTSHDVTSHSLTSHDLMAMTSRDLTLFASQVAAGMAYIAEQGIVHRDLAARNVLVDHNKVCKVSDFGMSRRVCEIEAEVFESRHRGALPIRWMSPESLYHNTFNQRTDSWSFGILLWEIITLGSTPYPGLSAREVMRSVREGYRLERPDHCHPQLYQLATSCWSADPGWRPAFTEIHTQLMALLQDDSQGYVDLDRFQEEIYGTLNKSSDEKV